jgi:hypothetical protein
VNLKLISCEVFYRELCAIAARSPHRVDLAFVPKGLHDLESGQMVARLQALIDGVDESAYDRILLAYGLCNNGVAGLCARSLPIVLPRAHDCITLFLGNRDRYLDYFKANPGTYFLTSGWIERGKATGELEHQTIQHRTGLDLSFEELVERYGEDNARYLYERLGDTARNYRKFAYIDMGLDPEGRFEAHAREEAERRGWEFEIVAGDISLLRRLADGPWDSEDFLTIEPGWCVEAHYGGSIVTSRPDAPAAGADRAEDE